MCDAGFIPVERDTCYNIIDRDGRYAALGINMGAGLGAAAAVAAVAVEGAVAATAEAVVEAAEVSVAEAAEVVAETASEATQGPSVEAEVSEGDRLSRAEQMAAATISDDNLDENNIEMSKKERVKAWLKRFWEGTKRSYKRFRILYHILFIAIFLMLAVVVLHFGLLKGTRHGESIEPSRL